MDISKFIDETKKAAGIQTDSALAKRLGVSQQAVSLWRTGKGWPDATRAAEMAALQGREPIAGIAAVELERHRENPAAVKFWRSQLRNVREFIVCQMQKKRAIGPLFFCT